MRLRTCLGYPPSTTEVGQPDATLGPNSPTRACDGYIKAHIKEWFDEVLLVYESMHEIGKKGIYIRFEEGDDLQDVKSFVGERKVKFELEGIRLILSGLDFEESVEVIILNLFGCLSLIYSEI